MAKRTMISPAAARALLAPVSDARSAESAVIAEARAGVLYSDGKSVTTTSSAGKVEKQGSARIPSRLWDRIVAEERIEEVWSSGAVFLKAGTDPELDAVDAVGIRFDKDDVVRIAREHGLPELPPQKSRHPGGRPPGEWWKDFAEELAIYIHEEGVPDVHGGHEKVISDVQTRMTERGHHTVPSRTAVQDVVRNVLGRIQA